MPGGTATENAASNECTEMPPTRLSPLGIAWLEQWGFGMARGCLVADAHASQLAFRQLVDRAVVG
jgi:hypothetical protein